MTDEREEREKKGDKGRMEEERRGGNMAASVKDPCCC